MTSRISSGVRAHSVQLHFPPSVLISSDPPAPKPSLDLNLCASGGSLPSASSSASQMEIGNSEIEAEIAPLGHNSDLDVENEVLETVNVGVGLGLSGIHGYQPQIREAILNEGIQFIYQ
ncbi:hypothetical protein L1987_32086 [Smallanthus sonchifolius]|uniref:Uncharacterized protein n=1 Tax=Smallanthus sonchifolius TaxID=185202 RepID=A0ACB9I8W0_9ASTR|nr:hypothetical protein L1987_32086 [Smallanthus sonchifolius]